MNSTSTMSDLDDTGSHHGHRHHRHHNYSDHITTSVTIRVTPGPADYFVSWSILWAGFVLATVFAAWQVRKENKILDERRQAEEVLVEQNQPGSEGDGGVSTADLTRSMFRKLLLLAMTMRSIMIPVEIWAGPIWFQFVGDTLPEMIFASAWTLLVSFFVQLVGIATGMGTNTSPGVVIQATAYVVYLLLITLQIWNQIASVLLYALLCCIYAALFGTVTFFGPRLMRLLQPSLVRHGGLALRLAVCVVLCIAVFLAHTIGYARKVVAPPRKVYWWWSYGALELFPSILFLLMMHPSSNKADRAALLSPVAGADDPSVVHKGQGMRRVESGESGGKNRKTSTESAPLLKGATGYGSTGDSPA